MNPLTVRIVDVNKNIVSQTFFDLFNLLQNQVRFFRKLTEFYDNVMYHGKIVHHLVLTIPTRTLVL